MMIETAHVASFEWLLELALIGLLGITLFHAVRLERALGMLKRDRTELDKLLAGFNASTQQAQTGVARLRAAAEGAGKQVAQQIDHARSVQNDLEFIIGRGEQLVDRIDQAIRLGRTVSEPQREPDPFPARLRSQAERDLLKALKLKS